MEKWVQVWGQSHAALSFFYYPSCPKTFRLVMCSAVSGKELRVQFSNKCGKNAVLIGAVSAAPCDKDGSFLENRSAPVTFGGRTSFSLGKGEIAVSDPLDFPVKAGEYFEISVYVEKGSLTSGNLLSNVNLITAKGNRTLSPVLRNEPRPRDTVRKVACKVLKMFFHKPIPLFDSVELLNTTGASAVTVFGDSISQQGFWTNALEERLREAYPGRYSLINKSIMGNRVLRDYSTKFFCRGLFGEAGITRMKTDVLAFENVEYVVFSLGINDFLQYGTITTYRSEKPDVAEFARAVTKLTEELHARGIKVIMLTMLAFGAFPDYRPEKETLRTEANNWLRENQALFDGFFDQDVLCRDPDKPHWTRLELLGPDKLHPNEPGGKYIASHLDLSVFAPEAKSFSQD